MLFTAVSLFASVIVTIVLLNPRFG